MSAGPATDGERWTRAALADLRAGRYGPAAWVRFLAASFRRSADDARRRPDLSRQVLAWGAGGAAGWAAWAIADPRALWGVGWWALVAAMLWWHLGMVEGLRGERRDSLGLATALTLLRGWLVPALPLAAGEPGAFAVLFLAGAAADAVDGPLARRRDEVTRLGSQADNAVDVALALSAAWTAVAAGWLPGWAALVVSARYLVPPLLIAAFYFVRARAPAREAFLSGRMPGLVTAAGLALAAVGPARPAAAALVLAGALGGAVTAGISIRRVARQAVAA